MDPKTRFGVKWLPLITPVGSPGLASSFPLKSSYAASMMAVFFAPSIHKMADDTRQSNIGPANDAPIAGKPTPGRRKPNHDFPKTQAGKMWEAFGNPQDPINEMPGGTYNSAGGKPKEVTWKAAFDWELGDVKKFYRVPCARDALLVGLGGGAAVSGVTAIIGGEMTAYESNDHHSLTVVYQVSGPWEEPRTLPQQALQSCR